MSIVSENSSVDELTDAMKANQILIDPLRPVVFLSSESLKPKPVRDEKWCVVGKLLSNSNVDHQEAQHYARTYWNLKKEVIVSPFQKKKNFFHFRFHHAADILSVNYPKPWLIHESILSIIQIPFEVVQKIKEEEFDRALVSITMKRVPNDYITYSALEKIATPAGKMIIFKDPDGRDFYEKNVEVMVDIEVSHSLPFGTDCMVEGVKTWIEFSYSLQPFKLCQFCRSLDHSKNSCTPKRREILAAKRALNSPRLINSMFNFQGLNLHGSSSMANTTAIPPPNNPISNQNPFAILDSVNDGDIMLTGNQVRNEGNQASKSKNFVPEEIPAKLCAQLVIPAATTGNHLVSANNKSILVQAHNIDNFSYNPFQSREDGPIIAKTTVNPDPSYPPGFCPHPNYSKSISTQNFLSSSSSRKWSRKKKQKQSPISSNSDGTVNLDSNSQKRKRTAPEADLKVAVRDGSSSDKQMGIIASQVN
ncbi:hypothetical protein MKW98_024450 [Papaver atlanticum]|uniref:DUF4283 domain-containing protein n=1 Tax=Papaver atlanticum TaxID=357466 RepID=A0AAD4XNA5_9MAGN|nr:hypothetical protein MKW98_024450 [Papaver atlanticum]